MMSIFLLSVSVAATRVKFVNNLPDSGDCAGHQLNLFVGGQRNVAAQKSLVVSDFDFESMAGAGIQVDVMTWSYDYTKNDGSTYQCPLPQKNGCNNPDNSALQIQIHSDCSWTQPCGGRSVPDNGAFCAPFYGYGVPTNGFTTVSVTKGSGDHDCVVTVSPQVGTSNWDHVCKTHISDPQSPDTKIPADASMYYKDLVSDIRNSLPAASNSSGTTAAPASDTTAAPGSTAASVTTTLIL
jgi:hypothetical protein